MNKEKLQAMLWGAFYGDAYALGAHWIYDTKEIRNANLDLCKCNNPISSYHPTKKSGDFTHYGDQMLWLLEDIAENKGFSLVSYGQKWHKKMQNYSGYIDSASKHTLSQLNESKSYLACGSNSSDLSVVGRMFPIIYKYHDSLLELQEAVKLHTIFTHMNRDLLDASAYFSEVMIAVLNGANLQKTINDSSNHFGNNVQKWTQDAKEALNLDTVEAVKKLGQACSVNGGFSSLIYLLLKYENDFDLALKENILAGGDSAARGMILGAILGAIHHKQILSDVYKKQMNYNKKIEDFLIKIDEKN